MIYRNERQWSPIEAYHKLVGTRDYKINIMDKTTSEFKHPFYTHDKFYWDADALPLMINGQKHDASLSPPIAITVVHAPSNRQVLATATIRSKTDVPNYIEQAILRDSAYTHDLSHISVRPADWNNKIFIVNADSDSKRFGLPPGADTDIYTDEEASGGVTFKQTWVG